MAAQLAYERSESTMKLVRLQNRDTRAITEWGQILLFECINNSYAEDSRNVTERMHEHSEMVTGAIQDIELNLVFCEKILTFLDQAQHLSSDYDDE